MIQSILFLFSLLASLLYHTSEQNIATATALEKVKKPNIILIMADDMGYEYGTVIITKNRTVSISQIK